MTHPTTRTMSAALLLALLALSACRDQAPTPAQKATIEQGNAAMTYWENKCKTVAGEKIYRKVEGVEGILLLKVRPRAADPEWYDRNFPGAALARESRGDGYIETFLGYEHLPGTGGPEERGYVNSVPSAESGYRYVDVIDEKDGTRYRYTGSEKVVGQKDKTAPGIINEMKNEGDRFDPNVYRWTLDKAVAPDPAPRYAVTYEDHVIPEERGLGVASTTLKVIDTQTNELLAESTIYAVTGGFDARSSTPPWLVSRTCATQSGGSDSKTRLFVDRVLIPARDTPK